MKDTANLMPLSTKSVLQIGCGSLGLHLEKHLRRYFKKVLVTRDPEFRLDSDYDYIFLATPDLSLNKWVERIRAFNPNQKIVHFSGYYYFSGALGIHPLCSFNKKTRYNFDEITHVVDGDITKELSLLFPKYEMIDPEKKKYYHTYISVAANALQLLSYNLGKEFQENLGLNEKLIKKIILQSIETEMYFGSKAFSGPWVRNEKAQQDKTVDEIPSESLKRLNQLFISEIDSYKNRGNRK